MSAFFEFEGQFLDGDPSDYDTATRQRIASDATFLLPDGSPLEGASLQRMRDRWAGKFDHLPPRGRLGASIPLGERRWLVEGLMPWGTIPFVGGQPKVGKTTMGCDIVASVLLPGYDFLDYFKVGRISDSEGYRGVLVINAETPAEDYERELVARGLNGPGDPGEWRLYLEHLEGIGGAASFDVTDPTLYEQWEYRFVECFECDGSDYQSPFLVVVDGITAILGGRTERYGQWYAAFRNLMRSVGVENAIVFGHGTYSGEHLMGGVEASAGGDGNWMLSRKGKRRTLTVDPRMGGVVVEGWVEKGDDGRLRFRPKGLAEARADRGSQSAPTTDIPTAILTYVARCASEGRGPSARELREQVAGNNADVDAARIALVAAGRLDERKRAERGGGFAYWPVEQEPDSGGKDSK